MQLRRAFYITIQIVYLLMFFIMGSTAYAEETVTETAENVQAQPLEITMDKPDVSAANVDNATYENLNDQGKAAAFGNALVSHYLSSGKNNGPQWLKTTDVQFNFTADNKPVYSLETLQPFGKLQEGKTLWFWQGRYAHSSDNSNTMNVGIGWRKLFNDKTSMIGFNTFYDHAFKYDLARFGVGVEYYNKQAEYRMNWYYPLSDEKLIVSDTYIRAVEGMDYEIGRSFLEIPWLKVYAGGYYWNNKYHDDEKGYKLRSVVQMTPRISLETGYNHSNYTHSPYLQLNYQLAGGDAASLFGDKKKSEARRIDLSNKLLQKVSRQNDIKTETYTKNGYPRTVTINIDGGVSGAAITTITSSKGSQHTIVNSSTDTVYLVETSSTTDTVTVNFTRSGSTYSANFIVTDGIVTFVLTTYSGLYYYDSASNTLYIA